MKRMLVGTMVVLLLVGALAFSGGAAKTTMGDVQIDVEKRNPWTTLRFNNEQDTFHFAVVSDRTGGHRARVFSQAIEQLNLLQPAFVVSVGDLIEGYTKDKTKLAEEWKEFQSYAHRLQMPFFYVPGNHDLANPVEVTEWEERFGRRYYHFVYRDVLFLALCADDIGDAKGLGLIGKDQAAYVRKVLEDNPKPRWTFVFLHKPMWTHPNLDSNGWLDVEQTLKGRSYTVFAGHLHRYQKYIRQGQSYYQLATTGGISKMRGLAYGEFDHIVWITMKKEGPVLANLMINGIYPEDLKQVITDEDAYILTNRKPVAPVAGKVLLDGAPVPLAHIAFHSLEPDPKRRSWVADGLVEADGSFALSTYQAFDGAPAGDYAVTVTWRVPAFDEAGKPGPNKLPEKYAKAVTSELRAKVKSGEKNTFTFELAP